MFINFLVVFGNFSNLYPKALVYTTGPTHANLVSLTSPCCSGWPAPMNTPLEEYSAHDWRAATSVQRAPVTWREWGLWFIHNAEIPPNPVKYPFQKFFIWNWACVSTTLLPKHPTYWFRRSSISYGIFFDRMLIHVRIYVPEVGISGMVK